MADVEARSGNHHKQTRLEDSQITLEHHSANDLGADSLDTVELVMELKRRSTCRFRTRTRRRSGRWRSVKVHQVENLIGDIIYHHFVVASRKPKREEDIRCGRLR